MVFFTIQKFDNQYIKNQVNNFTKKFKDLTNDKKEVLSLIIKFVYILINIYFNYSSVRELNTVYKQIESRVPSRQSNSLIKKLKTISSHFLKNEKMPIASLMVGVFFLTKNVTQVYNNIFVEKNKKNSEQLKESISKSTTKFILDQISRKIVESLSCKKII